MIQNCLLTIRLISVGQARKGKKACPHRRSQKERLQIVRQDDTK